MKLSERLHMFHRLWRYRLRAERPELRYLLGRQFHDGSLLDIGAHRGVYSYWMHRQFPTTQVVAFEPQPELVDFLADFKKTYRLERLHIAPVGLSSRRGSLPMHRPRNHWGAATVDEFCYDDDRTDVFDVPVTTVDEYLQQHSHLRPVRFIKCDVEYHEAEVLAGAERTLREDRPQVLVEWTTPRRAYRQRMLRLTQQLDYTILQFEYGRITPCTTAERQCPPSWELGPNYLLLPREQTASAAA